MPVLTSARIPAGWTTRPDILQRLGWSDRAMSIAIGYGFPAGRYVRRATFQPRAGGDVIHDAQAVAEWLTRWRDAFGPFTANGRRIDVPLGGSFITVAEVTDTFGWRRDDLAGFAPFGFPVIARNRLLRHELASWIDLIREVEPGFAATAVPTAA